jgi:signal transduction histidine kinase
MLGARMPSSALRPSIYELIHRFVPAARTGWDTTPSQHAPDEPGTRRIHRYARRMSEADLDFRLFFEASPDVLLVLLPDAPRFTMVAVTDARLAVTHTTRESTLGVGLFELFPDNPDDTEATGTNNLRASLMRVLATRAADTMAVQKYDIRGPDGTFQVKYWSPKNLPILGPDGAVRFIVHRVEDVTDLVQASELGEELRGRARQVEREVIARSRELALANRELREANAKLEGLDHAKTAFFSNVSHEFRTPLTLILGPIDHALNGGSSLSVDELRAVHRNAVRLLRLVNDLLDFSRIAAGGLQLSFAPTELGTFTAGLAGAFQSLVEDAGLAYRVDCPALPEPVYVDRARWENIVLNLISNAFKFTLEGGISVKLSWHGDHVELAVLDTGTGIPEQELPRVFERFHRVEGAQGRSIEGSGIGLALVRELAELHAGSVKVSSEQGRGTAFVVSLPTGAQHLPKARIVQASESVSEVSKTRDYVDNLRTASRSQDESAAPHAPALATPGPGSARARILVADDNADMRNYIIRLLQSEFDVRSAANGRVALQAARADVPDLILSDVMMPEMDGVALVAELRNDPVTRTVPVILLSARAGEDAVLAGLDNGADDYLVKPFSARELLARVRAHLSMARMQQERENALRELAETRASLVSELEDKNRDIRDAYRDLQMTQAQLIQSAKMASLGELVAGVAHEINNPLAFVLSHLQTVQRSLSRVDTKLSSGQAEEVGPEWQRATARLTEAQLGLERIRDLVLRLRTFSRLDEGEQKVVSIRESVAATLMILEHKVRDRVAIVTDFGEPDLVLCYPGLLNQALLNLVTNAADAIPETGSVKISTGVEGDDYAISVTDTGSGIPEEIRDRIFDPFFTTKPIGEGTGLGLSITYSIAKKHGGDLELRPAPGGGTVATLRFPLRSDGADMRAVATRAAT